MVKDAETNAAEDKKRRELVDAKNHAEAMIHSTEKNLAEHGAKLGAPEKKAIEDAVAELRTVKDGEDAAAIKAKTEALAQAAMKMGEAIYKAQQETPGGPEAGPGPGAPEGEPKAQSGEKVVDADFEEVKDSDKKKSA
jgi:molecular chaperone DnaK